MGEYSTFLAKGLTYFPIRVRFPQFQFYVNKLGINHARIRSSRTYQILLFRQPKPSLRIAASHSARRSGCLCIGAGFFGLSAALELAEKGKKVIVLEGARVGFGASGRSGGQAINGFEEGIDEYIGQVGFDKAKKLWDMSLEAH